MTDPRSTCFTRYAVIAWHVMLAPGDIDARGALQSSSASDVGTFVKRVQSNRGK